MGYDTRLGEASILVSIQENIKRDMGRIRNAVESTMGSMLAAVNLPTSFSGLVTDIRSLGNELIRTNAQFEGFAASMKVVMGSAGQARAMMREIEKYAIKTPFTLETLFPGVQQLIQAGFDPAKMVGENSIMEALGGAASSSSLGPNVAMERIIYAVKQMKDAGKVMGQEVLQLSNAGIPFWAIMAEQMGKSVPEVKKQVQGGTMQIDAILETFFAGLRKKYGGMMSEQSKTFAGIQSNIQDRMSQIKRELGGPIFGFAKNRAKDFLDFINSDAVVSAVKTIRAALVSFFTYAETMIHRGTQFVAQYGQAIQQWVAAAWERSKNAALAAWNAMYPILAQGIAFVTEYIPTYEEIQNVAAGAWNYIAETAASTWEWITQLIARNREEWSTWWVYVVNIWNNLKRTASQVFESVATVISKIVDGFSMDPVNTAVDAAFKGVTGLLNQFSLLSTNWQLTWELMVLHVKLAIEKMKGMLGAFVAEVPVLMEKAWNAAADAISGKDEENPNARRSRMLGLNRQQTEQQERLRNRYIGLAETARKQGGKVTDEKGHEYTTEELDNAINESSRRMKKLKAEREKINSMSDNEIMDKGFGLTTKVEEGMITQGIAGLLESGSQATKSFGQQAKIDSDREAATIEQQIAKVQEQMRKERDANMTLEGNAPTGGTPATAGLPFVRTPLTDPATEWAKKASAAAKAAGESDGGLDAKLQNIRGEDIPDEPLRSRPRAGIPPPSALSRKPKGKVGYEGLVQRSKSIQQSLFAASKASPEVRAMKSIENVGKQQLDRLGGIAANTQKTADNVMNMGARVA